MRTKIKFKDCEWAASFVKKISDLPCDINLYDGSIAFDAKSILAVLSLDFNKVFEIECITNDININQSFEKIIKEYGVLL